MTNDFMHYLFAIFTATGTKREIRGTNYIRWDSQGVHAFVKKPYN